MTARAFTRLARLAVSPPQSDVGGVLRARVGAVIAVAPPPPAGVSPPAVVIAAVVVA